MLSTIIFIITRGWHNRPGVAAVPIVEIKPMLTNRGKPRLLVQSRQPLWGEKRNEYNSNNNIIKYKKL
jgi:hypothetical protein